MSSKMTTIGKIVNLKPTGASSTGRVCVYCGKIAKGYTRRLGLLIVCGDKAYCRAGRAQWDGKSTRRTGYWRAFKEARL